MSNNILSGPKNYTLPSETFVEYLFKNIHSQDGSKVMMVDAELKESLTANEILEKSRKIACALKNYGIKQEDVVCIVSENSVTAILPLLASLFIGATTSLVNPVYTIRELRHAFNFSQPQIVFCSESALDNVLQLKSESSFLGSVILLDKQNEEVISLETFMGNEYESINAFRPAVIYSPRQVALILSSSGTTGMPKGVMLTHECLKYCLIYTKEEYFGFSSNAVIFGIVPFFHVFGLFFQLYGICSLSKLIILKRFKPELFLQAIEEYKITHLGIVPTLATFLAKSLLVYKFNLSSIRDIICSASLLPQDVMDNLEERFYVRPRQCYGLTETTVATIIKRNSSKRPNTVGVLMANFLGKIRNIDTKETLGPFERGEICLKGPTVMKGYINNVEATEAAFDEQGFLLTGDIGYYDEDGYFYIVDRLKDLIKYKGFQVAPGELESILSKHPAVKEVAVIGIPDERAGELPMAIVIKEPQLDATEQELIDFVAGETSINKRLYGGVKFVEDLPRNQTGKVLKKLLREMFIK